MKKVSGILIVLVLLLISSVQAEGLLPSLSETVGISMPSLGDALQRYPDIEVEEEDGSITELYTNITETDFSTFSTYLETQGAELADYKVEAGVLMAEIRANGASFTLNYNSKSGEAKVIYPSGTFDEWTKNAKIRFNAGQKLLEEGKESEALTEFMAIPQYSKYAPFAGLLQNDDDLAVAAREAKFAPYKEVGSVVTFGTYPQTMEGRDQTPIEWIVLEYDEVNHWVLLLSRYGLSAKPYNTERKGITWENCTIRAWLNNKFLNNAFTAKEQSAILITKVDNSARQCYSGWNISGGNNTQDRVFLLSYAEANKYLDVTYDNDEIKSRVSPTDFAIKTGANPSAQNQTAEGKPTVYWMLRSPGRYDGYMAVVGREGDLGTTYVNDAGGVVRPAIWLNLESDIF